MLSNQLNVLEDITPDLVDIESEITEPRFSSSLAELAGKKVIFRTDFSKECISFQGLETSSKSYQPRHFSEEAHSHNIAAVDSSCVLVGETDDGAIYAGRVATVVARNKKIARYVRAGPVLFYISPRTVRSLLGPAFRSRIANVILLERQAAERFIRIFLERTALLKIAKKLSNSVILVDGALRSSSFETVDRSFAELERTCGNTENQLLGFSKSSTLKIVNGAASSLQAYNEPGIFIDLTESLRAIFPFMAPSQSRIVVTKFFRASPVFRVDFSSGNSETPEQVLSDLRQSDIIYRGYPESLRLAHHLSVFDQSTVSSVRSYLSRSYGLIQVQSDDLRATVLGKLV